MEKENGSRVNLNEVRTTWIAADQIISPLGLTAEENYQAMREGKSGITLVENSAFSKDPVYLGKIYDSPPVQGVNNRTAFTRFERLVILSIQDVLLRIKLDTASAKVIFILSTTKGNIDLMEEGKRERRHVHLPETARTISQFFANPNTPLVISNACVSGVTAMLLGKQLVESGQYDHAVVTGADVLSRFIVSGFQCLSALSPEPCRPFDKKRKGTTLGEAAGTVVLTSDPGKIGAEPKIRILGGGLSNDANHISGPSRTGEELGMAIQRAIKDSGIRREEIDFVSAHGTATLFNDEMEAKAFNLSGLRDTPLNSLKGYFGHTLGAAGVVESVMSIHALLHNELMPTLGYEETGVSVPVNINKRLESRQLTTCLKTASGFGGCNAAMILKKAG